jgi:hypothetical protein
MWRRAEAQPQGQDPMRSIHEVSRLVSIYVDAAKGQAAYLMATY